MKNEVLVKRFVRGATAGAVTSMLAITISAPSTWSEMVTIFNNLLLAGGFGAITGLLMALDKWARWDEEK